MQRAVLRVTPLAGQGIALLVPPLIGALSGPNAMARARRKLFLNLIAAACCLVVVIISASNMAEVQSKAQLIGLIAGSVGVGATLVNAIKDHSANRGEGK